MVIATLLGEENLRGAAAVKKDNVSQFEREAKMLVQLLPNREG